MSASNPNSEIYMSDTEKQVSDKIHKNAFSGGQKSLELRREKGGNPDTDVPYQYLTYFEDDDDKLTRFAADYRKGEMLTGDMKKECIAMMIKYTKGFQEARAKVTDVVLDTYLKPRKLEWTGNPKVEKKVKPVEERKAGEQAVTGNKEPAKKKLAKLAETQGKRQEKKAAQA
jgi:tryptophanyl-tRNA synthetase